jgi:transposase
MAKNTERKQAHDMYVDQGKSGKEIAAFLGVQEVTISRWVNDGGWKAERDAKMNSSASQVQNIKQVIADITEQRLDLLIEMKQAKADGDKERLKNLNLLAVSLDDGISKWNKTLQNHEKENRLTLTIYLEVMQDVFNNMRHKDEKLHSQTLDFQEMHVQFISKKLG